MDFYFMDYSELPAKARRNIFIQDLKRKSKIKAHLQLLSKEELTSIMTRINAVFDEIIEEREREEEIQRQQREKALSVIKELDDEGIDKELLLSILQQSALNEASRVVYKKDGVEWSGKGRRPRPFVDLSWEELEEYRN